MFWCGGVAASDPQLDQLVELYDANAVSQPEQAKIYAEKAAEIAYTRGDRRVYHLSLRNLADLYNDSLHDKASAEALYVKLESSACKGESFTSIDCRVALQRLESFYADGGSFQTAERYARTLLTQDQLEGGVDSALALSSMTRIAHYQREQGELQLADDTCQKVKAARESMTANREAERKLMYMDYEKYCVEK